MENPYQAPQANLDTDPAALPIKTKRGWKVLFFILVGIQLMAMSGAFIDSDDPDLQYTTANFITDFAVYRLSFSAYMVMPGARNSWCLASGSS